MKTWFALELLCAALVSLALVSSRLEISRSAALRHALIASSLIAALLLPLSLLMPQSLTVAVPWQQAASTPTPEESFSPIASSGAKRTLPEMASGLAPELARRPAQPTSRTDAHYAPVDLAARAQAAGPWLAAIYVSGLLLTLWRLALSLWAVRRLTEKASVLPPSSRWHQALRDIDPLEPQLRSRVSLRLSNSLQFPATCGHLRRVIVVPSKSLDWSVDRCRAVLTHELAHIQRRDWLLNICCRLSCAVHWCNPLIWWGWREMRELAEEACDDAVVIRGIDADRYARDLVETARAGRFGRGHQLNPQALALSIVGPLGLPRRIDRLTEGELDRGPLSRNSAVAIFALVLATSLALGSVRLVDAQEVPDDQSRDLAVERTIRAAERGDLRVVREEVRERVAVNLASPGDGTLLIAAARNGRFDVVHDLLDRGADPNLISEGDGSPLLVAAERGDLELMTLLQERGALVDREAPGDGNPLIAAARAGQRDAVALLLSWGAEVDFIVLGDETALIQAAGHGHVDIATILLEHGADPNLTVSRDSDGRPLQDGPRSPLGVAREGGHTDVVRLLTKHGAR